MQVHFTWSFEHVKGESSYAYAGEWTDTTGLQYLRARYVNPYLNQFIQLDSIMPEYKHPQSLNKYSYALNNPIRYTDPNGNVSYDRIAAAAYALNWFGQTNPFDELIID